MGLVFFGAVCISFSAVFVKLADVAPAVSAFYRLGIGGLALLALLAVTGQMAAARRAVSWPAVLCALFFVGDLLCWHGSINRIGPGLATLVGNFQVFFLAAAGAIQSRRLPRPAFLAAMLVAMAGLYLVVGRGFSGQTPAFRLGVGLGLCTAVFYTGYILALKTAVTDRGQAGPMAAMAVLSLMGAAVLALVVLATGDSFVLPTTRSVLALAGLGLVGQGLGWVAISIGLSRTRPAVAGLLLLLQPTLSYVWDVLFFNKPTGIVEGLGVVLALAGIALGSTRSDHGKAA
jgi:drug/metabolite transporter (DMT)-like permease